jgi:hypothetical protein
MFQVTHCNLSGHCDYLPSAIMYASVTVIVGNYDCHSFQCDFHTINCVYVCVTFVNIYSPKCSVTKAAVFQDVSTCLMVYRVVYEGNHYLP